MPRLKRIVLVLVVLIVTLVVLGFVLENQQAVSIVFFGWASAELPVSVFIALALIMGMLIGPILTLLFVRRTVRKPRVTP